MSTSTTPAVGTERRRGLAGRLTDVSVRYVERFMPDPFLFALILTLLVVVLVAVFVDGATAGGIVDAWYAGVWGEANIFTFALQMVLILVTGYTMAEAPVFRRGISWLASKPRTQVEGALLCFGIGAVLCLLNWGLGLVAGALVARQVARRMPGHHFGYLVAAGYMGYMVWTQGLSSSIALANTDTGSPINIIYQMTNQLVPLSDTIFQPYSWVPVLVVIALLGVAIWKMAPSTSLEADPAVYEDLGEEPEATGPRTFATWLEDLWILNVLVFVAGLWYFVRSGYQLNIASMIMLFTITGALLHKTPIRFIRAFVGSARTAGPLLLQYPLYGGIIALLGYQATKNGEALETILAHGLTQGANASTLPFLTFLASIVISLFVPSGGGHWGVQGPIAVQSALALGHGDPMYLGLMSMSVAFGEAIANMIQPFWLLPVLAIAKLNVRQVMGFTVLAFGIGFVVMSVAVLVAPHVI